MIEDDSIKCKMDKRRCGKYAPCDKDDKRMRAYIREK